jgi:hypothetical protein
VIKGAVRGEVGEVVDIVERVSKSGAIENEKISRDERVSEINSY